MSPEKYALLQGLFPLIVTIVAVAVTGWVITTWMRIKHAYPLDGARGQAVYPQKSDETIERVRLLSQENAQLRAELGSVKDRLATVERIVTDSGALLSREIDQLRDRAN
nr:hypothetical protein [uncultured Sphingomonas sp.]